MEWRRKTVWGAATFWNFGYSTAIAAAEQHIITSGLSFHSMPMTAFCNCALRGFLKINYLLSQMNDKILGTFEKFENRLLASSCPYTGNNSTPTGRIFMTFNTGIFRKYVEEIQDPSKSDTNNVNLTWRPIYTLLMTSRSILLRMRNVSDKRLLRKSEHRFMFTDCLFRKSCRLWNNVEKHCRSGLATEDNMVHAHCMLDT